MGIHHHFAPPFVETCFQASFYPSKSKIFNENLITGTALLFPWFPAHVLIYLYIYKYNIYSFSHTHGGKMAGYLKGN